MNPDDLIRIARALASGAIDGNTQGRPRQTDLRRAVSAAYYALFHTLARNCADMVVGSVRASRSQQAWRQTYRALNHGDARKRCGNQNWMDKFPQEIRNFGEKFVEMQIMRHGADYDPDPEVGLDRTSVLGHIKEAEEVANLFMRVRATDRRAFAVYVLLSTRRD